MNTSTLTKSLLVTVLVTGSPLLPVGIWGTERAWPRNRKLPYLLNLADPPTVSVVVGEPYHPSSTDLATATKDRKHGYYNQ